MSESKKEIIELGRKNCYYCQNEMHVERTIIYKIPPPGATDLRIVDREGFIWKCGKSGTSEPFTPTRCRCGVHLVDFQHALSAPDFGAGLTLEWWEKGWNQNSDMGSAQVGGTNGCTKCIKCASCQEALGSRFYRIQVVESTGSHSGSYSDKATFKYLHEHCVKYTEQRELDRALRIHREQQGWCVECEANLSLLDRLTGQTHCKKHRHHR